MSGDDRITTGRAPEQLIAFAWQLKDIREHAIQLLCDQYVIRTIHGIVRRNPKLEGTFCAWTNVIYAVATSTTIRRIAGTNYEQDDVNLVRLFDCIIRDPEVLWAAFDKYFPTDAQQARSAVSSGEAEWRQAATRRLVGEDRKLLINRTSAAIEFANKRVAHHNAEAKVHVKLREVDAAINVLRDLTEKYTLLIWDEPPKRDLLSEMRLRKLPEGWDSIFLQPWATEQMLALRLGEEAPPDE